MKVLFAQLAPLVHDEVDAVAAGREQVVLQWCRPVVGIDDVAGLSSTVIKKGEARVSPEA